MINHRQEKGVQGILLKTSLSTLAAVAVILPVSAASGLPEVKPVFKPTAGKLVKPELKLMEVSKGVNPIFVCGNKRVAVREPGRAQTAAPLEKGRRRPGVGSIGYLYLLLGAQGSPQGPAGDGEARRGEARRAWRRSMRLCQHFGAVVDTGR